MMKRNISLNKKMFILFIVLFFVQIFCFNYVQKIYYNYNLTKDNIKDELKERNKIFVNETIRNEQRANSRTIKQTWMNYLSYENKSMIKTDSTGLYPAYKNDSEEIYYNAETMYKIHTVSNYFNIYSKADDSLIIENAKPEWNVNELDYLLNLLVTPIKTFGNNGGIIVYDSYSGEVYLDTTPEDRTNKNINMFEDYKNKECKNPSAVKSNIDTFIKMKKDSDSIENFIYMFNESNSMEGKYDNYDSYPLGNYNRQFAEKMILPYESFGFEGQPMQLTVILIADEQDIFSIYKENDQDFSNSLKLMTDNYIITISVIILLILLNAFVFIVVAYALIYRFKEKDVKEDKNI